MSKKIKLNSVDLSILKGAVLVLIIPVALLAVYLWICTTWDRHPGMPFIAPKQAVQLEVAAAACGSSISPFILLPSQFQIEVAKLKTKCDYKPALHGLTL